MDGMLLGRDAWYLRSAHFLGLMLGPAPELERRVASATSADLGNGLSFGSALARYRYNTGVSEQRAIATLRSFVTGFEAHSSRGAVPLAYFRTDLLPPGFDHASFVRTLRTGIGLGPGEVASYLTSAYGMRVSAREVEQASAGRLERAVAAYGSVGRLSHGSEESGTEARRRRILPRQHVLESCSRSDAVSGAESMLARFDRRLLDYHVYQREMATLYENSPQSLAELARQQSARHGMRMSPSTLRRAACEALAERDGKAPKRRPAAGARGQRQASGAAKDH